MALISHTYVIPTVISSSELLDRPADIGHRR
jgi:hypothetical protein